MIDAGDLAVNVGTILPLADARVAHEVLEGIRPRSRGKIVLSVGELGTSRPNERESKTGGCNVLS